MTILTYGDSKYSQLKFDADPRSRTKPSDSPHGD